MGLSKQRFVSDVDEEYLCPLCDRVLEDPLQTKCQHHFCCVCLDELDEDSTCPVDGEPITSDSITRPNKLFASLLNKLQIRCRFVEFSCNQVVRLETIVNHEAECDFNPFKTGTCEGGCGFELTRDEAAEHRCVDALLNKIFNLNNKILEKSEYIEELHKEMVKMGKEIQKRESNMEQALELITRQNCIEFYINELLAPEIKPLAWVDKLVSDRQIKCIIAFVNIAIYHPLTFRQRRLKKSVVQILRYIPEVFRHQRIRLLLCRRTSGYLLACLALLLARSSRVLVPNGLKGYAFDNIERERPQLLRENRIRSDKWSNLKNKVYDVIICDKSLSEKKRAVLMGLLVQDGRLILY